MKLWIRGIYFGVLKHNLKMDEMCIVNDWGHIYVYMGKAVGFPIRQGFGFSIQQGLREYRNLL